MLIPASLALALSAVGQSAPHDPRTSPTRVRHALYTLDGAVGPVAPIGDLDGDGRDELAVESSFPGERRMLALRAGGTGALLASFGEIGMHAPDSGPMWDIGPDLDGDGARDVALLVARKDTAGTAVGLALEVRSGRTAAPLRATVALPGQPRALTWISDIDSDGVADVAVADPSGTVSTLSGENGQELWRVSGLPKRPMVRLQNVGDRTGDRIEDLLLDENGRQARTPIWINGRDGARYKEVLTGEGVFTALGDIDGDGRGDLIEERGMVNLHVSGEIIAWRNLSYPAFCDYPAVELLGDIDGDGFAELGVGVTNFNLRGLHEVEHASEVVDLSAISLRELLTVMSRPMSMMEEESGCAWVVSGKTGKVLMGVYGEPGTTTVGAFIADVGDQDGDGHTDIAVSTGEGLLVFSTASVPARASADPFEWLPGQWTRETEREGQTCVSEEVWLSPAAGRMLGVARSYVRGADSGGSFEFLRIEREAEALVLLAQPEGRPPTRFVATELGPWRVLFTNPAHDFPSRILYFRVGDALHAHVGTAEEPTAQQFVWRRQEDR
jgi:hypothetical protein